ncbi:hypothetical protein CYMTET_37713 [Cymbomonas tetramitiformis]|uniref:Uncharacterized protein n=1 Tax=Cymbomonas tetramitiformis TaxID=36881 RepID=A0AAE0CF59_9CHLO|nr:hypothetical protein CYMTET_37713 [Cymbomonas tetramitiformis]
MTYRNIQDTQGGSHYVRDACVLYSCGAGDHGTNAPCEFTTDADELIESDTAHRSGNLWTNFTTDDAPNITGGYHAVYALAEQTRTYPAPSPPPVPPASASGLPEWTTLHQNYHVYNLSALVASVDPPATGTVPEAMLTYEQAERVMCVNGTYGCDKPYILLERIIMADVNDAEQNSLGQYKPAASLRATQNLSCAELQSVNYNDSLSDASNTTCLGRCRDDASCDLYVTYFFRAFSGTAGAYELACLLLAVRNSSEPVRITEVDVEPQLENHCPQVGIYSHVSPVVYLVRQDGASKYGETINTYGSKAAPKNFAYDVRNYFDPSTENIPHDYNSQDLIQQDKTGTVFHRDATVYFYSIDRLSSPTPYTTTNGNNYVGRWVRQPFRPLAFADYQERHERMRRQDWGYALATDGLVDDYAYRVADNQDSTDEVLFPEHRGGYIDGAAFWQIASFSWGQNAKHEHWPESAPSNIALQEYRVSMAGYYADIMRRPDYLPNTDTTTNDTYSALWNAKGLSLALGQVQNACPICGYALLADMEAFGRWAPDSDTAAAYEVVGPRVVFTLPHNVEDGESLWAELSQVGRSTCRAINNNTVTQVAAGDGLNANMPESYVDVDPDNSEDVKLIPPAWVVCKGFTVSVLTDPSSDATPSSTEVSVGFALDALRAKHADETDPQNIYAPDASDQDAERRKLVYTKCPTERWAGVVDASWVHGYDVATPLGTCDSVLILADTPVPTTKSTTKDSYTVSDGMDNKLGATNTKHNLCQTVRASVEKAYHAARGQSLTMTVNDEFDRTHEISNRLCADGACPASAFTAKANDVPTIGSCATHMAPPHPRLFVSDHGFLWGPTVSSADNLTRMSSHGPEQDSVDVDDPYYVEYVDTAYSATLPKGATYGTTDAEPRLNTTVSRSIPNAFFPGTYKFSTVGRALNVSATSNGARGRGVLYASPDSATSTSYEKRHARLQRAVLPVFMYDMYDVHVAEGNARRPYKGDGGYNTYQYSYATARSWRGFSRSALSSAYVAVDGWADSLYVSFDFDDDPQYVGPFKNIHPVYECQSPCQTVWNATAQRYDDLKTVAYDRVTGLDAGYRGMYDHEIYAPPPPPPSDLYTASSEYESLKGAPRRARLFVGNGGSMAEMLDREEGDVLQELCETFGARADDISDRPERYDTFNWEVRYKFTCRDVATQCETPSDLVDAPVHGPYRNAYLEVQRSREGNARVNAYRVSGDHAHAVIVTPPTPNEHVCAEGSELRVYRSVDAADHYVGIEPASLAGDSQERRRSFYDRPKAFPTELHDQKSTTLKQLLTECYDTNEHMAFTWSGQEIASGGNNKAVNRRYADLNKHPHGPCTALSRAEAETASHADDALKRLLPGMTAASIGTKMRGTLFSRSELNYLDPNKNYSVHEIDLALGVRPFLAMYNYWALQHAYNLWHAAADHPQALGFLDDVPLDAGDTLRSCAFRGDDLTYAARRLRRELMTYGDARLDAVLGDTAYADSDPEVTNATLALRPLFGYKSFSATDDTSQVPGYVTELYASTSEAQHAADGTRLEHECFAAVTERYDEASDAYTLKPADAVVPDGETVTERPSVNVMHPPNTWRMIIYQGKPCDATFDMPPGECEYPPVTQFYGYDGGTNKHVATAYNLHVPLPSTDAAASSSRSTRDDDDAFLQMCFDACMDAERPADKFEDEQVIFNVERNQRGMSEAERTRYGQHHMRKVRDVYANRAFRCTSMSVVEDVINRPLQTGDVYQGEVAPWLGMYVPRDANSANGQQKRLMCVLGDATFADKRTNYADWMMPSVWDPETRYRGARPLAEAFGDDGVSPLQFVRRSRVYDRVGWQYWTLVRDFGDRFYANDTVALLGDVARTNADVYVVQNNDSDVNCVCQTDTGVDHPLEHYSTGYKVCGHYKPRTTAADATGGGTIPEVPPEELDNLYSRCAYTNVGQTAQFCENTALPPMYDGRTLCTQQVHEGWVVECFPDFGVCADHSTSQATCEARGRSRTCKWDSDASLCMQRFLGCDALIGSTTHQRCQPDTNVDCTETTRAKCDATKGCAWFTVSGEGHCAPHLPGGGTDCRVVEDGKPCVPTDESTLAYHHVYFEDAPGARRLLTYNDGTYADRPLAVRCDDTRTVDDGQVMEVKAAYVTCSNVDASDDRIRSHLAYLVDGAAHVQLRLFVGESYTVRMHQSTSRNPLYSVGENVVGRSLIVPLSGDEWHGAERTDSEVLLDDSGVHIPIYMHGDLEGSEWANFTIDFTGNTLARVEDDSARPISARALLRQFASSDRANACGDSLDRCCANIVTRAFGGPSVITTDEAYMCADPVSDETVVETSDEELLAYHSLASGAITATATAPATATATDTVSATATTTAAATAIATFTAVAVVVRGGTSAVFAFHVDAPPRTSRATAAQHAFDAGSARDASAAT